MTRAFAHGTDPATVALGIAVLAGLVVFVAVILIAAIEIVVMAVTL